MVINCQYLFEYLRALIDAKVEQSLIKRLLAKQVRKLPTGENRK